MTGSLQLEVSGRRALLTGSGPELPAMAHRLLAAGAQVDVAADEATTSLTDLVQRGLVAVCPQADPSAYDLVISCRERSQEEIPGRADRGEVVLVGGGPGDPGLLTVAALAELRSADVVVYDRLAPLAALAEAPPEALLIDVGKIPRGEFTPQERINELLIEHAEAGRRVVRFKGGDNFVFGRGGEEALACRERGVPVRIVPGVSSAIAGPALAGVPVTHRSLSQGVTVVSGHVPPGDIRSSLDWSALARCGTTLVVLMGMHALPQITEELMRAGMPAGTPAATIADAALPTMRVVRSTVGELAVAVAEAGLGAPAVTVIGEVAGLDLVSVAAQAAAAQG
ncbi:uroporphyrin-III C-methyltransferase [Austwickia chelonae]|uniref:uroporphyrinogen-III C-methyltransferase n=1 Tax=Austwickia chelonae TaxID=100225 RepID=UPI0002EB5860|nr:uroporphyrinogen-III C-methyltransferase [Austwickia chelonae]SEV91927.1 uroporphyrin-III C-methyltransferase [Austwickia chelonae]